MGLVVTDDHTRELSHIYLTIIWNIIGILRFITTNNMCNAYVDINNATNINFTKSDVN